MAADIIQLMHRLNFQKVSVLGHSMGGRTMMYFALKYVCSFLRNLKNILFLLYIPVINATLICSRRWSIKE